MNDKLIVICGPTATGKTDLAIKLVKKFNGEIISADSRQVYQGMDVGTGKNIENFKFQISNFKLIFPPSGGIPPTAVTNFKFQIGYYLINEVKVWLYDIVKPDYQFNVADYKECADLVIKDILDRGKLPILVGGTGFYIKAVVDGIETLGVPPDWELRRKLSNYPIIKLQIILKKLDPKRLEGMNDSDRNNPRRLIRAIEIANWKCEVRNEKLDKEVRSEKKKSHITFQYPASNFPLPTSVLFIGLTTNLEYLYQRIDQRVDERIKNGTEEEIKTLLNMGYSFKDSVLGLTIGYREWQSYFNGNDTVKEVISRWKFSEHAYARRQLTWFKKALRQTQGENELPSSKLDGILTASSLSYLLHPRLWRGFRRSDNKRIKWLDINKSGWEQEAEDLVSEWVDMKI